MIILTVTRADGSRLTHIGRVTDRSPSQTAAVIVRILTAEPPGSQITVTGLSPETAQLIGMASRITGRNAGVPLTWERSGPPGAATLTVRPITPRKEPPS